MRKTIPINKNQIPTRCLLDRSIQDPVLTKSLVRLIEMLQREGRPQSKCFDEGLNIRPRAVIGDDDLEIRGGLAAEP